MKPGWITVLIALLVLVIVAGAAADDCGCDGGGVADPSSPGPGAGWDSDDDDDASSSRIGEQFGLRIQQWIRKWQWFEHCTGQFIGKWIRERIRKQFEQLLVRFGWIFSTHRGIGRRRRALEDERG